MVAYTCERIPQTRFQLDGHIADYVRGLVEQWLLVAPFANPAMLEMLRDRDCPPYRDMVPWAGEFAGKYLTGAVQVLRLTGDLRLRAWLGQFVHRLLGFQAEDGYLGPWPKAHRLTNTSPTGKVTWDTWSHYHLMLGLWLWHQETGDEHALAGAARIADSLCRLYLGARKPRLVDTGETDKNLAPAHALCLLYQATGTQRYLDLALQIVDEFAALGEEGFLAGDYLRQALAGKAFHEMPRPRWESLHAIMALSELAHITGSDTYRQAFARLWWSMLEGDRHNNGGFTSGERATGNPYDPHPIETCCTVAWLAMSVEMLKLTGNPIVADELELSTLNSVVGMHSVTGRWATYNTPMNGVRRASAHSIVFQAREGSPELNCCSVNSPRGFGLISEWAAMRDPQALILNWYGPGQIEVPLEPGLSVTLAQETTYPVSGRVSIRVDPTTATTWAMKLRIPHWSQQTRVWVNGEAVLSGTPGAYLCLRRRWSPGDVIQLELDMSLHAWPGERECAGLASLYRGPVLLTFDHRYNLQRAAGSEPKVREVDEWTGRLGYDLRIPVLNAQHLGERLATWEDWLPPLLLLNAMAENGETVRLCDFGSAGQAGTPYQSWLPLQNLPHGIAFSPQQPLRSVHLSAKQ
jgi:DUF1680 family protein